MSKNFHCNHILINGDPKCQLCGEPQFCVSGKPHEFYMSAMSPDIRRCAYCGYEEKRKSIWEPI